MPTYPLSLDCGPVRLTPPQWQLLCRVVAVLDSRPRLTTFLACDLWPGVSLATVRMFGTLAAKGILERLPTGYRLADGMREQVRCIAGMRTGDSVPAGCNDRSSVPLLPRSARREGNGPAPHPRTRSRPPHAAQT